MSGKPPEETTKEEQPNDQAATDKGKDGILWGVTGEKPEEDQVASNKSKDGILWGVTGEGSTGDSKA